MGGLSVVLIAMLVFSTAGSLAEPLRVTFSRAAWTGPTSNVAVTVTFKRLVKRTDPLRIGTYSRTLTFTLSTTSP